MRRYPLLSCLFVFALFATPVSTRQGDHRSFCDVIAQPEHYHQREVVTSGVIILGSELSSFFDPACGPTAERDVFTGVAPESRQVERTGRWKDVERLSRNERPVFVVVRATFEAHNVYEGPLPKDPEHQRIVILGSKRFGHNNVARFRLLIRSVLYASSATL